MSKYSQMKAFVRGRDGREQKHCV